MSVLVAVLAGLAFAACWSTGHLWTARQRTHRYAADMAAHFDLGDRAGWAYSDMATVIVMDGKAEPKKWIEVDE